MSTNGYGPTRQRSEAIAAVLRDAALLVGTPASTPVSLESGGPIVAGLGLESDAATLARRAKDLQEGIFKVIVYGEFKHGKSTLLNAMLGRKILPAKTLKCTAIISVLVYGEQPEVKVYETGNETPTHLSQDAFIQQFQLTAEDEETLNDKGYVDRFKHIEYAQVECLSPLCANGVRLVDSPGLGDHPSRTRVTTRYMRESHAIILMLNAMRLLSDDEKNFIRSEFKPGRIHNVFFVVNRVNQINQREVDEVQSYFRSFLAPYFTAPDGGFDAALYQRRVFFINALGALDARLSEPPDQALLAESGVPALEHELEQFLTSDEKHTVALDDSLHFLNQVVAEAQKSIDRQKALQDLPLGQFEEAISRAETQLQQLERKKQDIERTINLFGETIAQKICADLRMYLHELRENWQHDAQGFHLDEVTFANVMMSFAEGFLDKDAAQKRISEPIKREVEKYIQSRTTAWTNERVPGLVQPDLQRMIREIEEQLVEFKVGLERVGAIVAPGFAPDAEHDHERFSQWAQALIAQTLRDIVGIEGALTDWGNWSNVLWRILQQLLLLYVAVSFSGPVGWAVFAIAQVVQFIWRNQQFKQQLLAKIGDELHRNLQNELPTMQAEMHHDIRQQFTRLAQSLTSTLQDQMNEKRQELERILLQKRDASFSAEQEKQRLDAIGQRLATLARSVAA
jgi:GTPase SAR1 family protein